MKPLQQARIKLLQIMETAEEAEQHVKLCETELTIRTMDLSRDPTSQTYIENLRKSETRLEEARATLAEIEAAETEVSLRIERLRGFSRALHWTPVEAGLPEYGQPILLGWYAPKEDGSQGFLWAATVYTGQEIPSTSFWADPTP